MLTDGPDKNWEFVQRFLPRGWQAQAKKLGAFGRGRKINSPETLLRVLLIHLSEGCSLRETVMRAAEGGICNISDVALLKRLKTSSEWFRWMAFGLLSRRQLNLHRPNWLEAFRVRSFDATVVSEPGGTGADWRLHYSLELFGLRCDEFKVTRQNVGESFSNFHFRNGELAIGDRAYSRIKGLRHVQDFGANFLTRYYSRSFSLRFPNGESKLLDRLKELDLGEFGDWSLIATSNKQQEMPLRLCGLKINEKLGEQAVQRAFKEAKKKQKKISEKALEFNRYIILVTSLDEKVAPPKDIFELYRARWQIEIAFKRLKSIIGLGHLPKTDFNSAIAWLHGKLLVALLVQAIVDEGRFFSPWGYPLGNS